MPLTTIELEYKFDGAYFRVPLANSRDEASLGRALESLNAALVDGSAISERTHPGLMYLYSTFHTPQNKWLRERCFFARCAKYPSLHPAMLRYVELVNRKARTLGDELGHGDCHPAGSFAIVPLALRDPKYLGALIEHLRGWDMDHESWHPALFAEILRCHGICQETLDLLAWRAIESDGKSRETLRQTVRDHDLHAKLAAFGGLEGFADRAWRINHRQNYLPLYVGNAGRNLFAGDLPSFERWIAFFENKGLLFEESDRAPPTSAPWTHSVTPWPNDFEQDDD